MKRDRIPFAAGDYLIRYPSGSEFDLEIESPVQKPGWQPRQTSGPRNLIFPGATVRFEDRTYEIARMESTTGAMPRVRYFLKLWEERFPIRVQFHYTKEECERLAQSLLDRKKSNRINITILLLAPLFGLLPGPDQHRLENSYGISAQRLTFVSAILLLISGGAGLISFLVSQFGQVYETTVLGNTALQLTGCYFFLESLVRLHSCMVQEEPMGTLPVFLVFGTYRMISRSVDPAVRQEEIETKWKGRPSFYLNTRDQVSETAGPEYHLEIVSVLPKPHWNMLTGILYRDTWYGLIDSQTVHKGQEVRYRFLLKKVSEGTVFRSTTHYTPDEVSKLYKDERRREMGVWVKTFAPFWGLLNEQEQERLEQLYDFDTLKFSHVSMIAIGIVAFFNFVVSVINILSGIGRPLDVILLLLCGYLLYESYDRREKWKTGKPSGSALAVLLRPFASKLLR